MNLPFNVPRPNMEIFRINRSTLTHGGAGHDRQASDDDREPLSPRPVMDVEAQAPEMAERSSRSRFLQRMPRPTLPSFLSSDDTTSRRQRADSTWPTETPRPTSSRYSGDAEEVESPKTPRFLTIPNLPSTRLHLPNLTRTWTQGSNGPPSRPGTAHGRPSMSRSRAGNGERFPINATAGIAEPMPVATGDGVSHGSSGREARARRFRGADPEELHLAEIADEGRRRRRHRRGGSDRSHGRSHGSEGSRGGSSRGEGESRSGSGSGRSRRRRRETRPTPKHFLFCFPWIRSRTVRALILRSFVSGMFLALLLTIFLSLTITKNINNSEFSVLLILIILFVAVFFCHGLVRLCLLVSRGAHNMEDESSASRSRRLRGAPLPQMVGPGGYAIPRRPIRVVLARDEEAAGIESEETKMNPPAYGLWRESVRVDPNRIYWMRNEEAPATVPEDPSDETASGHSHDANRGSGGDENDDAQHQPRSRAGRPPSYMSDDGVTYVVEARPRSMAPGTDVPLVPHPAEVGRMGRPSEW